MMWRVVLVVQGRVWCAHVQRGCLKGCSLEEAPACDLELQSFSFHPALPLLPDLFFPSACRAPH
eukprot:1150725-Pelagomonas_calceolata.AAC.10